MCAHAFIVEESARVCRLKEERKIKKERSENRGAQTLQDAHVQQTHWDHIPTVNCFIKPIITAAFAERLVKQHVSILIADPGRPFN